MTFNYNVTLWTSTHYYIDELAGETPAQTLSDAEKDLKKAHAAFYKYIGSECFSKLFQLSRDDFLNQSNYQVRLADRVLDFHYFKKAKSVETEVYKLDKRR